MNLFMAWIICRISKYFFSVCEHSIAEAVCSEGMVLRVLEPSDLDSGYVARGSEQLTMLYDDVLLQFPDRLRASDNAYEVRAPGTVDQQPQLTSGTG